MTILTNPLVILELRRKVTAFYDALRYLASLAEIKLTSRPMLHVFFVVVIVSMYKVIRIDLDQDIFFHTI